MLFVWHSAITVITPHLHVLSHMRQVVRKKVNIQANYYFRKYVTITLCSNYHSCTFIEYWEHSIFTTIYNVIISCLAAIHSLINRRKFYTKWIVEKSIEVHRYHPRPPAVGLSSLSYQPLVISGYVRSFCRFTKCGRKTSTPVFADVSIWKNC
jgi:hypothetical protein